jgi:hypothetical protein
MAKLVEKYPVSDHIRVSKFPAAKEKGEIVMFGSLIGFSDYNTAKDEAGSIDVGREIAVFEADSEDLAGDAAVGSDVYLTAGGGLTMTATANKLFGTIVDAGAGCFDFAVTI